jgi:hypothetical protein
MSRKRYSSRVKGDGTSHIPCNYDGQTGNNNGRPNVVLVLSTPDERGLPLRDEQAPIASVVRHNTARYCSLSCDRREKANFWRQDFGVETTANRIRHALTDANQPTFVIRKHDLSEPETRTESSTFTAG